jgi:hypothetical protein
MIIMNNNITPDFWFYQIGVNVIPAHTVNKTPVDEWSLYQDKPIPSDLFEQNKRNGAYKKGIAIIPGRVWRGPNKDKYLVFIDLDNQKAIDLLCNCFGAKDLEDLSQYVIVEIHKDDIEKAHLYFYSNHKFSKKSSDVTKMRNKIRNNDVPAIEVKELGEHGIAFCSPSLHKDGQPYEIIGTRNPKTCGKEVEDLLIDIYRKYNLNVSNNNNQKIPIGKLFEKDYVILEGHNRHEAIMRMMESLIQRNQSIMPLGQIKKIAYDLNQQHCQPPLDDREFEKQWTSAINFLQKAETKANNHAFKPDVKEPLSSNDDDVDEQESVIEKIVTLIENRCIEIFSDQFNEVYALVQINGHFETLSIDSNRFERLVIMECFSNKIPINKDRIKNITDIIKTKIEFSNDVTRRLLNLRIAKSDSSFYYDLVNSKWETVKISQDGWNVIPNNQAIFKRYKNNMEQVYPNKNHSPDCIDRFLNLINLHSKKDKLLLLVYLVSLFVPDIAKPILLVYGSKGAAKTTTFELIKNIIDPSIVDTLSFPKETNDLIQIISHNYVAYFDNISAISHTLSDLLCRAVTGTGASKRKNYTDDDVFIYKFKRALGINGINIASVRPDFLDRCLILEVNRIPKERRRKEENVKKEFMRLLPDLLGWILDVLVKVLKYKNENPEKTRLKEYPRMADFAEYGEVIARCIGYGENVFIETYFENMEIQDNEVIESSVVANILIDFMEDRDKWEGSATQLHATLTNFMESIEGPLRKKHNIFWPSAPNTLSRKINELAPTLKEKGLDIIHNYDNKRRGRQIKIINLQKISSLSSYRGSSGDDDEETKSNEQDISNFFTSYGVNEQNNLNSPEAVAEITASGPNDRPDQDAIGDTKPNIHEIADRLYPGSDVWVCKNCNERGDR